jgi:hypothetical protein
MATRRFLLLVVALPAAGAIGVSLWRIGELTGNCKPVGALGWRWVELVIALAYGTAAAAAVDRIDRGHVRTRSLYLAIAVGFAFALAFFVLDPGARYTYCPN